MLFTFTIAVMWLLGHELSFRLSSGPAFTPFERAAASVTLGAAIWIASLWACAITGNLAAPILTGRTMIAAVIAVGLSWTRWRAGGRSDAAGSRVFLIAALPLGVWLVFMLWRGVVIPPLSHDALSHHLPKAVFYVRAEGYEPLAQFPTRARGVPVNYELILAEVIATDGDDRRTEWPSAAFYLAFVVAAGALVQRWWGANPTADAVVMLLVAAVPVALLHSGAIKNDLMSAAFMTLALVWFGRYVETGEVASLCLLSASLVMATGTKPQGAMLAIAVAPFVLRRMLKDRTSLRTLAGVAMFAAACVALLGGAYLFLDRLSPVTPVRGPAEAIGYGDWSNLLYVPWILLSAPFSASSRELWVPWATDPWFWRRYEVYFSELGIPWAVCALLLPLGILAFGSHRGSRERIAVSLAVLFTFAAMMPVRFTPLGMYAISTPRYVLFVVPVVFAWTAAPWLRLRARPSVVRVTALFAVLLFAGYALLNATRDVFAPGWYVAWAARHAGARMIPFAPARVASLLDRVADPQDAVAVELADGAWIHPLFGPELTRPVHLIVEGDAAPRLGSEIRWVMFDRTFSSDWKHPGFANLGQARSLLARGNAALDRDPLFRNMLARPDFELVYYRNQTGEALFHRRIH